MKSVNMMSESENLRVRDQRMEEERGKKKIGDGDEVDGKKRRGRIASWIYAG